VSRRVRTPGGKDRYGQPIGSRITPGLRYELAENSPQPIDATKALDAIDAFLKGTDVLSTKDDSEDPPFVGDVDVEEASPATTLVTENFDGTDCATVQELAAANGLTDDASAIAALTEPGITKALRMDARRHIKQLSPGPESNSDGIAIVFTFGRNEREQLAMPNGEPPDDLHVTLGYFGSPSNTTTLPSLQAVTMQLATEFEGFTINLNGISRFSGEDTDPIVVNADAVVLPEIYSRMRELADTYQVNYEPTHGYSPHMTLGYIPYAETMPITRWTPVTVTVDMIELWYGKARYAFPLGEDFTDRIENIEDEYAQPTPYRTGSDIPEAKDVFSDGTRGIGKTESRRTRRREMIERRRKRGMPKKKV
jgi:2'-5' RNA ligase